MCPKVRHFTHSGMLWYSVTDVVLIWTVLSEIHKKLRPGGWLGLSVPKKLKRKQVFHLPSYCTLSPST